MASNPISNQTGKVRRVIAHRITATADISTAQLARFMHPVKIKSACLVPDGAGSSPVCTFRLVTTGAEGASGAVGSSTNLSAVLTPTWTAGTRTDAAITATDLPSGGGVHLIIDYTSGTIPGVLVQFEYEEDLD